MNAWMIFLLVFLFVYPCSANEPDWLIKLRNLKVLESTRSDVERQFRGAKVIDVSNMLEKGRIVGKYFRYETDEGLLNVDYSGGTCSELRSPLGYDVVSGTVTQLRFKPTKPVKSSVLKFSLDSFLKQPVKDVPGLTSFLNPVDGIKLTLFKGKLTAITFDPPAKFVGLECNEEKAKSPQVVQ